MAWYHGHSLQDLIVDHDIHLVLAIDKAISKDRLDLNVIIDAR